MKTLRPVVVRKRKKRPTTSLSPGTFGGSLIFPNRVFFRSSDAPLGMKKQVSHQMWPRAPFDGAPPGRRRESFSVNGPGHC